MAKIRYFFVFLLLLVGVAYFFMLPRGGKITLKEPCVGEVCPYAQALVREVNKIGLKDDYTLYVANFAIGQQISEVDTEHNVLWLGSTRDYLPDFSKFDYVLASTPLLKNFLSADLKDKVYYLPLFADTQHISKTKGKKFIAVIGDPPFAEEILKEKGIPYRLYQINERERILGDMSEFQAVIALHTALNGESIDLSPIFYTIAAQDIPLVTWFGWNYFVEDTLNLFNNRITFYIGKSDLERFIAEIRSKVLPKEIATRVRNAERLVKNEYSLKHNAEKLSYLLQHKQEPKLKIDEKSLNFDLPVAVGHTTSGDFALISDLESYMCDKKWHCSMSFFNSLYKYPTKVNILIRGFSSIYQEHLGEINIFYLVYPQQGNDANIDDVEAYYNQLARDMVQYDAVAVASKNITQELLKRGIKAYYVPQFTNPKRFYPAFDKNLASEILFVGINASYRRAPQIALKHNLPITIYGPEWKGAAVGDFIDNRELYKYYSSAKIVLNDSRKEMLAHNVISNRIFDATACGTLVISDYIAEIEEIYGDSVPMWKTEEELVALIKYYLDPAHEKERLEKAKRAQAITLQHFTADKIAERFEEIIHEVKQKKR